MRSPKAALPSPVVESLQPTFSWEPSPQAGVTYDVSVCSHEDDRILEPFEYRREGLTQPSHRIEVPLEPDREYAFSVRYRNGTARSAWSRYQWETFHFYVLWWTWNQGERAYRFRTPRTVMPLR